MQRIAAFLDPGPPRRRRLPARRVAARHRQRRLARPGARRGQGQALLPARRPHRLHRRGHRRGGGPPRGRRRSSSSTAWSSGAGSGPRSTRRDAFGAYVALGITTLVGAQALVNLAVVFGLLPTKGLTLPFVSYGGSSLLDAAGRGRHPALGERRRRGGFLRRGVAGRPARRARPRPREARREAADRRRRHRRPRLPGHRARRGGGGAPPRQRRGVRRHGPRPRGARWSRRPASPSSSST